MNKVELLAPAGSLEKLKYAIAYGADAVYIGGEAFSLRVAAKNFSNEEIKEGVEFAHQRGKKVYIAANIFPHNRDIDEYREYMKEIAEIGVDGVIISDLGAFALAKEAAPDLEIHVSTQANNVNYMSARMWYQLGAKRVVLAREMSFEEIREIREKIPQDMEIECFVHGAMCISYSGRCLLSNYMTERDSNQGACSHPCRWKYSLVEEQRPGEYMPVFENDRGTFIFNSKDLCMIEHIPEIINSGITSLKIEGRVKNELYVATVVKAYREALDSYYADPENYQFKSEWLDELKNISHRRYTTGFYMGKPTGNEQVYDSSTYIQEYITVAVVKEYNPETKEAILEQRNRFFKGDQVEFITPGEKISKYKIEYMCDKDENEVEVAPHPKQIIKIKTDIPLTEYSIVRMKK